MFWEFRLGFFMTLPESGNLSEVRNHRVRGSSSAATYWAESPSRRHQTQGRGRLENTEKSPLTNSRGQGPFVTLVERRRRRSVVTFDVDAGLSGGGHALVVVSLAAELRVLGDACGRDGETVSAAWRRILRPASCKVSHRVKDL